LPLSAMAGFLVLTALITAGGRLPFGLQNVFQDRYATNGLLALFCVTAIGIMNLSGDRSWFIGGMTALPVLGLLLVQVNALHPDSNFLFQQKLAGVALRVGAWDDDSLQALIGNSDYIRQIAPRAKAEHLSIFANNALGFDAIPDKVSPSSKCVGNIESITDTKTPGIKAASGWIYDPLYHEIPANILLVNTSGHVVGQGITGLGRSDVAQVLGLKKGHFGWKGFFRDDGGPIKLYAKAGSGYCAVP
ncbi:MAG TPA: hypothetical protein VHX39_33620, partial [Acetobacteraceae bacterium]|nr:hypothetical protein [Acetobacteraceae bacterium]